MSDKNSEIVTARYKARMEKDFVSSSTGGITVPTDERIASALDYIAYQLGQINRKLDKVIEGGAPPVDASPPVDP